MKEISAKVVLDSTAVETGCRLITVEATYNRFIHSELMTHRVFSRNAASSRAIPVEKQIKTLLENPALPIEWGKNQKGMQAEEILSEANEAWAKETWLDGRDAVVKIAERLNKLGVHKQLANRWLEVCGWMTTIITATQWRNFRFLRTHKDAQPEFQVLAKKIVSEIDRSVSRPVSDDNWHTPYIQEDEYKELDLETRKKVSVARCARVSYLTQDGKRDINSDLQLFDRLVARERPEQDPGHFSPTEHVARPIEGIVFTKSFESCDVCYSAKAKDPIFLVARRKYLCDKCGQGHKMSGNFRGWYQLRKDFGNENLDT